MTEVAATGRVLHPASGNVNKGKGLMNTPPPPPLPARAPPPPPKRKGHALTATILLGVLGLVFVGAALDDGGADGPGIESSARFLTGNLPEGVYTTTASELSRRYESNEVATDQQINGRPVLVSGRVESIDKDFWNNVVIHLAVDGALPASMRMLDDQTAKAAALSKGEMVTIHCEGMRRMIGSPSGSDCTLLAARP